MTDNLRIACLQLNSGSDYAANLATLDGLMRQAAAGGAKFIFSPEYALMMDGSGRVMREKRHSTRPGSRRSPHSRRSRGSLACGTSPVRSR